MVSVKWNLARMMSDNLFILFDSLYQADPLFDIAVLGMPFDTAVSYR